MTKPDSELPAVEDVVRLLNDVIEDWEGERNKWRPDSLTYIRWEERCIAPIRALRDAYPSLVRDRERLDWLAFGPAVIELAPGNTWPTPFPGTDLRDAIDAASTPSPGAPSTCNDSTDPEAYNVFNESSQA